MKLKDARVLIVDDEPILLAMFAKWLATVGCSMILPRPTGPLPWS
jgi:hypothetical protein